MVIVINFNRDNGSPIFMDAFSLRQTYVLDAFSLYLHTEWLNGGAVRFVYRESQWFRTRNDIIS